MSWFRWSGWVLMLAAMAGGWSAADVVDDLDAVQGIALYRGSASGKDLLRQNGFVVVPRFYHRIFGPYLDAVGKAPDGEYTELPPFVTADSVHRTFHVLFEESLKDAEAQAQGRMSAVTKELRDALRSAVDKAGPAQLAYGYFGVAYALLQDADATEATDEVGRELALIRAAEGIHTSPLFGYKMDYSQFKPRGFYTKTPELRSYFRAMTWFGCAAFRLKSDRESAAALCIVDAYRQSTTARDAWSRLDRFYTRLLSPCDDLTVAEYADIVDGLEPGTTGEARLAALRAQAWALRDPEYSDMVLLPAQQQNWVTESKGMRFMGRRYLPDGEVLAKVTEPNLPGRYFPTGLDVLAANGAARATEHLSEARAENPAYAAALDNAALGLSETKQAEAGSHYVQLLEVMATLTAPPVDEAAEFAKTPAYADKNLMTASAVWASTRHAWVLHGKENTVYLCDSMDRPLPGYIEPNPAFFNAMVRVTDNTLDILRSADLEGVGPFEDYRKFLENLQRLLDKQLRCEAYSDEEQAFFFRYGRALVRLQGHETNHAEDAMFPWMALVADVFTEALSGQCLEVATGGCMPIYAIVDYEGSQHLTLGAVYSYYEFWQPISERLTDDVWHGRWDAGTVPPMPGWTTSFIADGVDVADALERLRAGERVPEAVFIQDPRFDAFLLAVVRGEELTGDEHFLRRTLLVLAGQRMPDEVKPLLLERLRTMPIQDYEEREEYLARMRRGDRNAVEYFEQERRERGRELQIALRDVGAALGPCLDEDDLDVLWEVIEEGDANRATAVVQATMAMEDKAAERFWLRVFRESEGATSRYWAMALLAARGSLDVVADLCVLYEQSKGEDRNYVLGALSGIWCESESVGRHPQFDCFLSAAEREALRVRTCAILTAYSSSLLGENEADSGGHRVRDLRPREVVALAVAVEFPELADLFAEGVRSGAWKWNDAVSGLRRCDPERIVSVLLASEQDVGSDDLPQFLGLLGAMKSKRAIPVLRKYLNDRTQTHTNGLRVCDHACAALDSILGVDTEIWRHAPKERRAAVREEREERRKELLELTASADGNEKRTFWVHGLIGLGLLALVAALAYRLNRKKGAR